MPDASADSGRPKALIAWSSGKDSAWSLYQVRRSGTFEIVGALTTVTEALGRVSMHGVSEKLLRAQLAAADLRPVIVRLPYPCPDKVYEARMGVAMADANAGGVTHVVFGDLFLEDIRIYRERKLAALGMTAAFPLWASPTDALASEMLDAGLKAHLVCVDLKKLPSDFAGRRFDADLIASLPAGIDHCGENGEFHTFVSAGPMLKHEVVAVIGETTECDGFAYAELRAE
jgi:diphthamide synthase (EF-2-diphthine--ammonia ligase)